jgi:CRISPR-associated protein (TIGR02584 family)
MTTTLLAVTGTSPAILTETVWALAAEDPPVIPNEVLLVTTSRGRAEVERRLLAPRPDWDGQTVWQALRAAVFHGAGRPPGDPALQLSFRVIELPDPATGVRAPAEDLRTPAENAEAADFILRAVSSLAEAADSRLVASIAGGRKTMSALLYGAMTLLGSEGDRVTHVLVSEPFEHCRDFFFPAQPLQRLEARNPATRAPTPVAAAEARIDLADLPFVPLRNGFAELREKQLSFPGLVARYSIELKAARDRRPALALDTERAVLTIDGTALPLTGRELLAAAFLFLRLRENKRPFPDTAAAAGPYLAFVAGWQRQFPNHKAFERRDPSHRPDASDLTKALSSLRKKLADRGLAPTIPFLAPPRSRIGFDADPA